MAIFKYKDYEIFYDIQGSGKPIMILNGIMMSTASWNTFVNTVTNHNTLVRIDFLDQGGSTRLNGKEYTHDLQAEITHALIQYLELKDLTICGVS